MAIKLPDLQKHVPIVENVDKPSFAFSVWWNKVVRILEQAFNTLEDNIEAINLALEAAGIAQVAAENAQAAADAANASAAGSNSVASLTNSGVTGCTISATDAGSDASITISNHTRVYGDGTNVAVTGATLTGRAYSTFYYIYYEDAARTGGAVTYLTTTDEAVAVQTGNRHVVGSITTPAAAGADQDGTRLPPPGQGGLQAQ